MTMFEKIKKNKVTTLDLKEGFITDLVFDDTDGMCSHAIIGFCESNVVRSEKVPIGLLIPVEKGNYEVLCSYNRLKSISENQEIQTVSEKMGDSYYDRSWHLNSYSFPIQPFSLSTLGPYAFHSAMRIYDTDNNEKNPERLRSCNEVLSYSVTVKRGKEFGSTKDLIIDDQNWSIRGLVTSESDSIKRFIVPFHQIRSFNWGEQKLSINLKHDEVNDLPCFYEVPQDNEFALNRASYEVTRFEQTSNL